MGNKCSYKTNHAYITRYLRYPTDTWMISLCRTYRNASSDQRNKGVLTNNQRGQDKDIITAEEVWTMLLK